MKGSEGLEQPFTILTYWYSDIYTEKVKGEGFSRIFFCTDNLGMEATISTAECFPSEAFWCTSEAFWCTSEAFWCASEAFWQTAEALWRRFCSCFCQTLQPLNNNFKQIKTMPKYKVNSSFASWVLYKPCVTVSKASRNHSEGWLSIKSRQIWTKNERCKLKNIK